MELLDSALSRLEPDILLTYGGDAVTVKAMEFSKAAGAAVVFALHNFSYRGKDAFRCADAILVPSEFCAAHYGRTLGLDCQVIPSPIDEAKVVCDPLPGQAYVTFVNPVPHKGVYAFATIVDVMARTRPDIPFLVVEGRGKVNWLLRADRRLERAGNIFGMPNTNDPREFYQVSRLVVMPSLWQESFGRVAAEAMMNGIPVIGSDRGALPEVLGEAGVSLSLPKRLTPESRVLATHEEIAHWTDWIVRIWDENDVERAARETKCVAWAAKWNSKRIARRHDEWLRAVARKRRAEIDF